MAFFVQVKCSIGKHPQAVTCSMRPWRQADALLRGCFSTKEVDEPDPGTGSTVRAAWFPT